MDMALVNPHVAALPESNPMTAASEFQTTQAKISHRFTLADIENILSRIGTSDDDFGISVGDDPDGGVGGPGNRQIPESTDAVRSRADLQSITGNKFLRLP